MPDGRSVSLGEHGYDLDDEPDDAFDSDSWIDEMNCGSPRKGQCSQVGSEYCDFECPFRQLVFG